MADQTSADPAATEHLRAGERITLDELAVHLNAAALWLRQLAIAAETPDVPVDLGGNVCDYLDSQAKQLSNLSERVAQLDQTIADRVPLASTLPDGAPWGARAHQARDERPDARLVIIPTMEQVLGLVRWHQATRVFGDLPARPARQRPPSPLLTNGIPYLDGLADLPDLEHWESPRAARRREAQRQAAIQGQALQEDCSTCQAAPGAHCRTRNGRIAEAVHRPRINAATHTIDDAALGTGEAGGAP
ncbi:hypothetical protein [Spirillospora sp. CA-294931]|uniref:hypothetical protein n=1 Tax=Spirillospora sp. CA-294931 TaxID=3240042 RepID=UPI003D9035E9